MKILVAHSRYRSKTPSGENRVVDTEAAALRAAGHEVVRFERCSDDIAGWTLAHKAALPVTSIWDRSARAELAAVLADRRPDVVHVHNTFPLLSASVLAACADARVPVVVTLHNYRLACAKGTFFRAGSPCHDCAGATGIAALGRGCYRDAPLRSAPLLIGNVVQRRAWRDLPSAYIFISDAERRALAPLGLPTERQFVKWNMVPAPPLETSRRRPQVVYMGRLDEAKGLPVLMAAWDRFREGPPAGGLRLAIAGTGPMDAEVRAWAAHHDDVDVVGLLDAQACRRLALTSLAAVVPSVWEEPFGLVAVEAMANGLAVIGSDIGALPELIDDGRVGVLVPAGEPSALASALDDVAGAPRRWRAMGCNARQLYEERFDPGANLEQLLDIYRYAIDHPAHDRR